MEGASDVPSAIHNVYCVYTYIITCFMRKHVEFTFKKHHLIMHVFKVAVLDDPFFGVHM